MTFNLYILKTAMCVFDHFMEMCNCCITASIINVLLLIHNRFCKDTFDKNYKATIGVDFEMERFEVLGVPFSLQL